MRNQSFAVRLGDLHLGLGGEEAFLGNEALPAFVSVLGGPGVGQH